MSDAGTITLAEGARSLLTYIRFSQLLDKIERIILPKGNFGNKWHADETVVKIRDRRAYVWNILDSKTRYLLASYLSFRRNASTFERIFNEVKRRTKRSPRDLITDDLSSYSVVAKKNYYNHIAGKKFVDSSNNNRCERLNKTIKRRVRYMEKFDNISAASKLVNGFRLYYNLVRPNMAIRNSTPALKAKMAIQSRNPMLSALNRLAPGQSV